MMKRLFISCNGLFHAAAPRCNELIHAARRLFSVMIPLTGEQNQKKEKTLCHLRCAAARKTQKQKTFALPRMISVFL